MRAFDLIFYGLLVAVITYYAVGAGANQVRSLAAIAPLPEPAGVIPSIPALDDVQPEVMLRLPGQAEPGTGTAFSIGEGMWFTARHVVDGCADVGVVTSGEQGVLAETVTLAANTDLAIVRAPLKRLPFPYKSDSGDMRPGARAFHIGYPQGVPGEVASRLLGRELIAISGRFEALAPILAWAETNRTRGIVGSLGGLSGGPTFTSDGEVVGVVIAEAPRRGRIYTAAPDSVASLLTRAQAPRAGRAPSAGDLSVENYAEAARTLRRDLRVAKVVCVVS